MYIGNDLRSGRAEVFHYTSTSGGETVVTTASDGRAIRYDVGFCYVYLNGVRLHDSDYSATTGNSITNLDALSQNDVLIVEAPKTFSTDNTVPASGGSFTGPLTIDGGINQKAAAQDLSGTYANERMYINDLYSLKGDVNITGHLALGSISSGDIVISDDGNNREISGTGTLETGGILQERNTLLTGMTGEIGSAVTFPAGHTIQTFGASYAPTAQSTATTSSGRVIGTNLEVSITPKSTSNFLECTVFLGNVYNNAVSGRGLNMGLVYSTNNWSSEAILGDKQFPLASLGQLNANTLNMDIANMTLWVQVPTTSPIKIQIYTQALGGDIKLFANYSATKDVGTLIIKEIQG